MINETFKKMLENITDEDELKSSLSFAAFFIALYENFVDLTIDRVKSYYCNGFDTDENGRTEYTYSPEYKKVIIDRTEENGKKSGELKATLLWLIEKGAIDQNDFDCFYKIRDQRNKIVHELMDCVLNGFNEDEGKNFLDLLNIYKKIDRWWINEIEIPTSADDIPQDYDPNSVGSVISGMFDIMVDVIFRGKSEEHKELLRQYFD